MRTGNSSFVIGLALILSLGTIASAQIEKSPRYQKKIDFEVVITADANILSRESCLGLKWVFVHLVNSKDLSAERITSISKQVAATYPAGYDLIVTLGVDRKYAESPMVEQEAERGWARSLRGIYFRSDSKKRERLLVFPLGTTPAELDSLVSEN